MMVHLFEIADYSLKGLTDVPQDVSCTSQARKWGILGEPDSFKEPIMSKVVFKYILFLREAGLVIQPLLFWLGASPDGLIYDKKYSDHLGLLEIKYTSSRRNSSPADLLSDQSFYLQQNKNKLIIVILLFSPLNA